MLRSAFCVEVRDGDVRFLVEDGSWRVGVLVWVDFGALGLIWGLLFIGMGLWVRLWLEWGPLLLGALGRELGPWLLLSVEASEAVSLLLLRSILVSLVGCGSGLGEDLANGGL
jgi:hypothetical protein